MALWQSGQKLFLPPPPVTLVRCTDTYVRRKGIFYHGETSRLLTVGHPFYRLEKNDKEFVPKVSPHQYRVFRVSLPDPNQFSFQDKSLYDPGTERLVWAVVGSQVSRGQPLGPSVTGHPLLNAWLDAENMGRNILQQSEDDRKPGGIDAKQTQLLLLGCKPAMGEYWTTARPCIPGPQSITCPPLELKTKHIEDGDMMEIGFGAADFYKLNGDRSSVPLDIAKSTCLYPDYLQMAEEATGDMMFYYARREQTYARHVYIRCGKDEELDKDQLWTPATSRVDQYRTDKVSSVFYTAPSGSLVSTDGQLFNRPYWLRRAQGMNNGICWRNTLFVTVGDNTRGTNFTITDGTQVKPPEKYNAQKVSVFQRHVEEFKLSFIFELCVVQLNSDTVAHLRAFNPEVLEDWEVGLQSQAAGTFEDRYRFLDSVATKCPDAAPPPKPKDPYHDLKFWEINLTDKLSRDLDQFPLGRRFLSQTGLGLSSRTLRKRKAPLKLSTTAKRKKKQ